MNKIKLLFTLLITTILPAQPSVAQDIKAVCNSVDNGYNFWLSTPKSAADDCAELVPLVIFLHGSSLCGNDLNRVMRYGTMSAIEKGLNLDAYVIAPQNPGGSWKPDRIMNVVDYVIDSIGGIDTSRIYVLGMSLGGYGTIDLAATYPNRIAAAMAMCGGAGVRDVSGLNKLPLWIIHGTSDAAVSIRESDKVVERMRADDPDLSRLIYTRVPGMNHSEPARLFYMPEVYEWLFTHSLEDYDREVSEGFNVDSTVMKDAYRNIRSRSVSTTTVGAPVKRPTM